MEASPREVPTLDDLASDPELARVFVPEALPASRAKLAVAAPRQSAPSTPADTSQPYVVVSPDGMMAHLAVPRTFERISAAEATAALEQASVTQGVDTARVEQLESGELRSRLVLIARGTPPRPGKDASIEYLFPTGIAPEEWATSSAPMTLIHDVAPGAELARRTPPQPGRAGVTVRGDSVAPKAARDAHLTFGSGAEVMDGNPDVVVATAAGVARLDEHGRVSVDGLRSLRDIDGNVEFAGSVLIRGDVKRGFTVKAGGDIEVTGMVANARIMAGGSILIQGGVFADVSTPYLQAGRDVLTRRAERAVIKAGRNTLLDEAIDCDIDAGDSVIAAGSGGTRGSIRGGSAAALHEIVVRIVGAPTGGATKLRVGYEWLVHQHPETIESELATRVQQLAAARAKLAELGGDDEPGESSTAKLRLAETLLQQRVRTLHEQLHSSRCIVVREALHPGTELTIDGVTATYSASEPAGRFVAQGGRIVHAT